VETIDMKSVGRLFVGILLSAPPLLLAAPLNTQYEVQKLVPTSGAGGFGQSIAISGDRAIISRVGGAYVYTRQVSGEWVEEANLFGGGSSVAISGNTAVIGAILDDDNGEYSGSAYVFNRDARGLWSQQARLLPSDGEANDAFGGSVATTGDMAVIGSPGDDDRGSAYVFTRDALGKWSQQAKLQASDGAPGDAFGGATISDDMVLISNPTDDDSRGSVYVFTRDARGVWSEQVRLRARDRAPGDTFGGSVAISGDTALIGASADDDNGPDSGSVYVFHRDATGAWFQQAKLVASDGVSYDSFGSAIAVSGDRAVIGAFIHDEITGQGYVYKRDANGSWFEQTKLIASDATEYTNFGYAAAFNGENALIGALNGSAYAFDLDSISNVFLHCPGDVNKDGTADLLVVSGDEAIVKGVDGSLVNQFTLAEPADLIDSELMPDTNANGSPELVVLRRRGGVVAAEVRDLSSGAELGKVDFGANLAPLDLELVPDRAGNGIPEFAILVQRPSRVLVRDGLTGAAISTVGFANYVAPKDLQVYRDLSGNDWPELAVLGENRDVNHADKIEIRDSLTGSIVRQVWLARFFRVLDQARIRDLDGNNSEEVAVLRRGVSGYTNVQIRDTVTKAWVNFVGFAIKYPPKRLIAIRDINGNGSDELVVFGRRFDGTNQKAVIKDSRTRAKLGELWFDRNFPGRDFVSCGDINGNGATDLALLGQRLSDRRLKVIVKDGQTGERLALVWF
jgi:hypothetical protein